MTNEIEFDGAKFIPITKLKLIFQNCYEYDYLINLSHALSNNYNEANIIKLLKVAPVSVSNILLKWLFDIFGLINKGLAVDINKLIKIIL